jgi:pSer/pThr/pTyr-binding forkhead associated (FHA) protein
MDNDTIIQASKLGKHLDKVKREESRMLLFNNRNIPLVSKITIGRSSKSNIVVEDILASRNHALIQKIKIAYFIKDLNSTNGTYVNNRKIPNDMYVKLKHGDVIRIGKARLVFT